MLAGCLRAPASRGVQRPLSRVPRPAFSRVSAAQKKPNGDPRLRKSPFVVALATSEKSLCTVAQGANPCGLDSDGIPEPCACPVGCP
jgi:hypothetical protein